MATLNKKKEDTCGEWEGGVFRVIPTGQTGGKAYGHTAFSRWTAVSVERLQQGGCGKGKNEGS